MSDMFNKGSGRMQYNPYMSTKQIKINNNKKQSKKWQTRIGDKKVIEDENTIIEPNVKN